MAPGESEASRYHMPGILWLKLLDLESLQLCVILTNGSGLSTSEPLTPSVSAILAISIHLLNKFLFGDGACNVCAPTLVCERTCLAAGGFRAQEQAKML